MIAALGEGEDNDMANFPGFNLKRLHEATMGDAAVSADRFEVDELIGELNGIFGEAVLAGQAADSPTDVP